MPEGYQGEPGFTTGEVRFYHGGHQRLTHKTSGFKTSGFKTSSFKTSGLQNVRFTKCQVSTRTVSKRPVFTFDILVKQKVFLFAIFTYF